MPLVFSYANPINKNRLIQVANDVLTIYCSNNKTLADKMEHITYFLPGKVIKAYQTAHCGIHDSVNEFRELHVHHRIPGGISPQRLGEITRDLIARWNAFYPNDPNPFAVLQDPTYSKDFTSSFARYCRESSSSLSSAVSNVADYFQSQCPEFNDPKALQIVQQHYSITNRTFVQMREELAQAHAYSVPEKVMMFFAFALMVSVVITIIGLCIDKANQHWATPNPAPAPPPAPADASKRAQ